MSTFKTGKKEWRPSFFDEQSLLVSGKNEHLFERPANSGARTVFVTEKVVRKSPPLVM